MPPACEEGLNERETLTLFAHGATVLKTLGEV
jgi:hypothetical protein